MSCSYIPELFPIEYLGRQCVPLSLSSSPCLPHEVPHALHPWRCDVYRLELNTPRLQNRTDRLLLGGYLLTETLCRHFENMRLFTFALPELPLMNTLMAMFKTKLLFSISAVSVLCPPSFKTVSGITNVDTAGTGRIRKADPDSGDDTMTRCRGRCTSLSSETSLQGRS